MYWANLARTQPTSMFFGLQEHTVWCVMLYTVQYAKGQFGWKTTYQYIYRSCAHKSNKLYHITFQNVMCKYERKTTSQYIYRVVRNNWSINANSVLCKNLTCTYQT